MNTVISEPVDVISVKLILRLPEDVSGVQDFLGHDQFLENIIRELADTQRRSEARTGFGRSELLADVVMAFAGIRTGLYAQCRRGR
jgi:hypothetical protein